MATLCWRSREDTQVPYGRFMHVHANGFFFSHSVLDSYDAGPSQREELEVSLDSCVVNELVSRTLVFKLWFCIPVANYRCES